MITGVLKLSKKTKPPFLGKRGVISSLNILYFLRVELLSISFFVEVLCLITVSLLAFSVVLRAEELSPVDCCLVVLAGSAFCADLELEAGPELTVSDDDLLLVTVLCPADEFVLALVLPSNGYLLNVLLFHYPIRQTCLLDSSIRSLSSAIAVSC